MNSQLSRTARKDEAAKVIAANWRIRSRLSKLTAYAYFYGYISYSVPK